jgi:hypothetical protein
MALLRSRTEIRRARWAFAQVFFPLMLALAALVAAAGLWGR